MHGSGVSGKPLVSGYSGYSVVTLYCIVLPHSGSPLGQEAKTALTLGFGVGVLELVFDSDKVWGLIRCGKDSAWRCTSSHYAS